ncbi:hypothetical protein IHE44_0011213 [Lamprotornis superbus]|uniref:Sushi domain-containing protein 1 n=1 Tax=Lamprotornis superbus TaxID=245042 RepID=A0A835NH37_9PASS|nr:hypothetical protein IHE44_0011213 [Lamprotornis superbus]
MDKDECQIGASKICGNHTLCHNTHGSFYCVCLDGYRASNNNKTFIPNDGTNCTGVDCGVPPSVLNAHPTSVSGTTYRSEVTYDCARGYLMAGGNRTAVCNAKGHWDGPDLVCKEIDCGKPLLIPHTTMTWDNSTTLWSRVYYHCKEGYYFNGDRNFSECTIDQSWENITYVCKEALDCRVLEQYCEKDNSNNKQHLNTINHKDVCKKFIFHILGQRLDEKIFSEDVIFNISTSEDNPSVCLDLNSGSNYMFHIQGQRWYQKNFFHEMTFELSTHKQAPEICLDLQPGTNYSINISMDSPAGHILMCVSSLSSYEHMNEKVDSQAESLEGKILSLASEVG